MAEDKWVSVEVTAYDQASAESIAEHLLQNAADYAAGYYAGRSISLDDAGLRASRVKPDTGIVFVVAYAKTVGEPLSSKEVGQLTLVPRNKEN